MKPASTKTALLIILLSILTMAALVSCSPDNTITQNRIAPEAAAIQFKIDGQLKKYEEAVGTKTAAQANNYYTFVASKNPEADNLFTITLKAQDLKPGTYSATTGVITFREGNHIATNVNDNDFNVTIISNADGVVNGYFSGTLYDDVNVKTNIVVEGLIKDVRIN